MTPKARARDAGLVDEYLAYCGGWSPGPILGRWYSPRHQTARIRRGYGFMPEVRITKFTVTPDGEQARRGLESQHRTEPSLTALKGKHMSNNGWGPQGPQQTQPVQQWPAQPQQAQTTPPPASQPPPATHAQPAQPQASQQHAPAQAPQGQPVAPWVPPPNQAAQVPSSFMPSQPQMANPDANDPFANYNWDAVQPTADRPPFLGSGRHHLKVISVDMGVSQAGHAFYRITCEVIGSTNPLHPTGSLCTIYKVRTWRSFPRVILSWAIAVSGWDEASLKADKMKCLAGFCDVSQPLLNVEFQVNARDVPFKDKPGSFTNYDYAAQPGRQFKDKLANPSAFAATPF